MTNSWMIYGANGYTGRLIAEQALREGIKPILAGRSPRVAELAKELGLESRIFALGSSPRETASHLEGVSAVLHCAGPFIATSQAMLDACIEARAHYLDIAGEIDVFEGVFAADARLKAAGVSALPGAGFDVVPSDCLAAMLKERLPQATRLTLAFSSDGGVSPGTAKCMAEAMALGGRVRIGGSLVTVPTAARSRRIDFDGSGKLRNAILAPWGDVSTAYHSTGIPDIEFYIATPALARWPMKAAAALMRAPRARRLAQRAIGRWLEGPSEAARARDRIWLWGEVADAQGKTETLRLQVPEGYGFTALSAVACARRVAAGELSPGAWTPSRVFGADFALSIPGVRRL